MTTSINDYLSVRQKAADLGCVVPEGIALLPMNFETATSRKDFRQRSEAATVRSLLRANNLPLSELLPAGERAPYIQNNAFELLLPTIFIAGTLMSQNPAAVSLGLNVLASYVTDFFKGIAGEKHVKFDIVIERKGSHSCKMVSYEGDASGLQSLPDIIGRLADE
jgi:hypothetical protein